MKSDLFQTWESLSQTHLLPRPQQKAHTRRTPWRYRLFGWPVVYFTGSATASHFNLHMLDVVYAYVCFCSAEKRCEPRKKQRKVKMKLAPSTPTNSVDVSSLIVSQSRCAADYSVLFAVDSSLQVIYPKLSSQQNNQQRRRRLAGGEESLLQRNFHTKFP